MVRQSLAAAAALLLLNCQPAVTINVARFNATGISLNATASSGPVHVLNMSEVIQRGSHAVNLLEKQVEYEFSVAQDPRAVETLAVVVVNKAVLVFLTFCCGFAGLDRCYAGAYLIGCCKGLTCGCGGCLVLVDIIIIFANAMMMKPAINSLGWQAKFEPDSISTAFYTALIMMVWLFINNCAVSNRAVQAQAVGHVMPSRVSGVLRQSGVLSARPSIEDALVLFSRLDVDGSGTLTRDELRYGLMGIGVSVDEIDKIFEEADSNKDGQLDFQEFVRVLTPTK